uniref:Uncharacterized protein n=1 Tax=Melanothamnus harveyi TaxID=397005 RepID=A0A1Z1MI33_MELHR|nr:hypothetical protein [Melanothamnus harveyi]ARW65475.1 hypothetical protein [Melanothamnus harveyi]
MFIYVKYRVIKFSDTKCTLNSFRFYSLIKRYFFVIKIK